MCREKLIWTSMRSLTSPAAVIRGTRSSLGTVVPAGVSEPERNGTALPITVLVEDQFGATAIALHR